MTAITCARCGAFIATLDTTRFVAPSESKCIPCSFPAANLRPTGFKQGQRPSENGVGMRQATKTLAVIAVLAFSGCIGAEPLKEGTTTTANVEAGAVLLGDNAAMMEAARLLPIDAPTWAVGDAWTIESFGFATHTCTLVVVDASPDYVLAPTCQESAILDATYDVSYLGRIRARDLAGSQQGDPVRFFDFPLTDGKKWTTTWDRQEITLTATFAPTIAAPGLGSAPGFTITGATSEGEPYVAYDYSPALKWWTTLDFFDYGIRVKSFQSNWTGTYKTAAANPVFTYASSVPGFFVPPASTFTVNEDQTALVVMLIGQFGGHAYTARLVDPAGSTPWDRTSSAQNGSTFDVTNLDPTPGQWTFAASGMFDPTVGSFSLSAIEVKVDDATLSAAT